MKDLNMQTFIVSSAYQFFSNFPNGELYKKKGKNENFNDLNKHWTSVMLLTWNISIDIKLRHFLKQSFEYV